MKRFNEIKGYIQSQGYKLLSRKYINAKSNLYIQCKVHGIFSMNWNNFKSGQRCKKCSKNDRFTWNKKTIKNLLKDTDYIYFGHRKDSKRTYVTVVCSNKHRKEVRVDSIYRGQGCLDCFNDKLRNSYTYVKDYVAKKGFELLSSDYINNRHLLEIKCKLHGVFNRSFSKFVKHSTCPFCSNEINVRESECRKIFENIFKAKFPCVRPDFLKNQNTGFNLELDGFNSDLKLAFEYDGIQHYEPVTYFGGKEAYDRRKKLDQLKDTLCEKEGIILIRIPYYTVNLEDFIVNNLTEKGVDDRVVLGSKKRKASEKRAEEGI